MIGCEETLLDHFQGTVQGTFPFFYMINMNYFWCHHSCFHCTHWTLDTSTNSAIFRSSPMTMPSLATCQRGANTITEESQTKESWTSAGHSHPTHWWTFGILIVGRNATAGRSSSQLSDCLIQSHSLPHVQYLPSSRVITHSWENSLCKYIGLTIYLFIFILLIIFIFSQNLVSDLCPPISSYFLLCC